MQPLFYAVSIGISNAQDRLHEPSLLRITRQSWYELGHAFRIDWLPCHGPSRQRGEHKLFTEGTA